MALPQDEGQQAKQQWTVEEYFQMEESADVRHEYVRGRMYAMAGATEDHSQIAGNIYRVLANALLERPCRVFQSEMRVQVADDIYFYPDVSVICGEEHYRNEKENTLLNPNVIIEVLSPSTSHYDKIQKMGFYAALPSVTDILLVAQEALHILHYSRQEQEGELWRILYHAKPEATIELPSMDGTLPVSEIYRKVRFDEPQS